MITPPPFDGIDPEAAAALAAMLQNDEAWEKANAEIERALAADLGAFGWRARICKDRGENTPLLMRLSIEFTTTTAVFIKDGEFHGESFRQTGRRLLRDIAARFMAAGEKSTQTAL